MAGSSHVVRLAMYLTNHREFRLPCHKAFILVMAGPEEASGHLPTAQT